MFPQLSFGQLGWAIIALQFCDQLLLFDDALFPISDELERRGYPMAALALHCASFPSEFAFAGAGGRGRSIPNEASTCLMISSDEAPSPCSQTRRAI